ncbi:MAG: phosphopentomutase [Thermoleophilaceae bacterium]|jgi:phosphopentomutase|nr:phosphopentomutase [Thermoleophilaceae bacterium]
MERDGRRALVVVLDACGCGALPDAEEYGDAGTNTLAHVADAVGGLDLPTLQSLGLGNITPIRGVDPAASPAVHGRLWPLGPGKDTTAGHWEMMGVSVPRFPVYPRGFPPEVIASFERATGRRVIGNAPSEGLRAIFDHGERHMRTGELIVYTSQDSVFQIAAHTDVVGEEELYEYCLAARRILSGEHAVGRVIARPFDGVPGAFRRTSGRRDFALPPPGRSYLDELTYAGVTVHAVGKVGQVFAGRGVSFDHHAPDNPSAIDVIDRLLSSGDAGFVFANLVDTDQVYGHRKDVEGFAAALREIDAAVGRWLVDIGEGDLLVICADHGVDPAHPGSDHTREYSPLLAVFAGQDGRRVDAPLASIGASVSQWLTGRVSDQLPGEPFVS